MQRKLSFPSVYVAICCVKPERLAGAGHTTVAHKAIHLPDCFSPACFYPLVLVDFCKGKNSKLLCADIQAGPAQEKRGK